GRRCGAARRTRRAAGPGCRAAGLRCAVGSALGDADGGVVTRPALAAARRVVVKVGSSSLTSLTGGLDPARLDALVDARAKGRAAGSPGGPVSWGAIAAGLAPLGLARRPRDLATQQAAAAVGQLL